MVPKSRVILTRRWPQVVEDELQQKFDTVLNPDDSPMDVIALRVALTECDALCPTVTDRIDAAVLEEGANRAGIIANFGVGYNHIDLDAARRQKLVVTNTPDVLTDCTADLTLTLLLMVARRAGEGERHVRAREWSGWRPTHMLGAKVTGKTLGLVGFGRIARAVAHRAHFGFGMRIVFYDPQPPADDVTRPLGAEPCASVEEVLRRADFVSLHCPGGSETFHLIDAARIAAMRPGAFLINTARGDVIDQSALITALQRQRIAGAGLDVYAGEPAISAALLRLDNVVLLPHLGSATTETRVAMGRRVITNLELFFAGKAPPDRVV